jgi:hypothetical protein
MEPKPGLVRSATPTISRGRFASKIVEEAADRFGMIRCIGERSDLREVELREESGAFAALVLAAKEATGCRPSLCA